MLFNNGTSGRTRTATPVKAMDFESIVSTNFTTLAQITVWRSAAADEVMRKPVLHQESDSSGPNDQSCGHLLGQGAIITADPVRAILLR